MFTAIICNYRRPQNINSIVEKLLRARHVDRIWLTNNNPAYRAADLVRTWNPRIEMVDQPRLTCKYNSLYLYARDADATHFLTVDDDTFLTADQVDQVCEGLLADERAPHGVFGQVYLDPEGTEYEYKVACEARVDTLNMFYAYTKAHVLEFFELLRRAGFTEPDELERIGRHADDVVLSMSGSVRPFVHGVGPMEFCDTYNKKGYAACREDGFLPYRRDVLRRIRDVKGRLADD